MARKTVKIGELVELANRMILQSPDSDRLGREYVQTMVERILLDHGQYQGFSYLTPDEMLKSQSGVQPGIRPDQGPGQFIDTDPTRVRYGY